MGQWANPPLDKVTFRLGFLVNLGIERRVAEFQRRRGCLAETVLRMDEKRPQRGLVPHYVLINRDDPKFTTSVTHADAHFIEAAYTDWPVFRKKVVDSLGVTPIPEETDEHDFIGLVYADRLRLFPTHDRSVPIQQYLRIKMEGPAEFFNKTYQRAAWETDYQMKGPNDLMRVVVQTEPPDDEGIEHLLVSVDRRIVGLDRTPVEEFLEMAHQDTKRAFETLLQPEYLAYLKEGRVSDASNLA